MNLHSNKTRADETREAFCQVFQKDLSSLYQLALLLTGDYRDAESILVAGFEECAGGNPVFKKWARSWARRIIITKAIRLIAPLSSLPSHLLLLTVRNVASHSPACGSDHFR